MLIRVSCWLEILQSLTLQAYALAKMFKQDKDVHGRRRRRSEQIHIGEKKCAKMCEISDDWQSSVRTLDELH